MHRHQATLEGISCKNKGILKPDDIVIAILEIPRDLPPVVEQPADTRLLYQGRAPEFDIRASWRTDCALNTRSFELFHDVINDVRDPRAMRKILCCADQQFHKSIPNAIEAVTVEMPYTTLQISLDHPLWSSPACTQPVPSQEQCPPAYAPHRPSAYQSTQSRTHSR